MKGGTGNDMLSGGAGNDYMDGGARQRRTSLDGGTGADTFVCGSGNDTYVIDSRSDALRFDYADPGIDTVRSSVSWTFRPVSGKPHADRHRHNIRRRQRHCATSCGNDAANVLSGKGGNDAILGGGGQDKIYGGLGAG